MSAASTKTQDPSMEEILASIRRIIADEGDAPATSAESAATSAANAGTSGQAAPETEPPNENVLDLADVPEARRRVPAALEIEPPDLSFRDGSDEPAPAPAGIRPAAAAKPAASEIPERVEPKPSPSDSLISQDASASVTHAFNLLSHTILTQNARTLEDLVREMLKPMLKVWLDDNLPPLVERLVRAEIERVARGSR